MFRFYIPLMAMLWSLIIAGCGQSPSFTDSAQQDSGDSRRGSEDPNAKKTPHSTETNPECETDPTSEECLNPSPNPGESPTPENPDSSPTPTPSPGAPIVVPPKPKAVTLEKTYSSDVIGPAQVAATLDSAFLLNEITLKRNYTNEQRSAHQITRPQQLNTFIQGYSPTDVSEAFLQKENRPLDIVLVVDNSASMVEEQTNLSQKLGPLMTYISQTDWQIGVVTTDPNNGCLRSLIKKSDSNAETKFINAVKAGTNGNGNERGVYQAVNSLSCQSTPWVRDNSTVAVLFVSDEDNCSDGTGCGTAAYKDGSYLYNYLASIRQPGVNARVYGIIKHPSLTNAQCSTAENPAPIYAQLIAQTNGTWGSICDADYTPTLMTMSQNIAAVLGSKFTLKSAPNPNTLRVYVNNVEILSGFTLTGKVVEFTTPPANNDQIKITYSYDGKPIEDSFTLQSKPVAEAGFSVSINALPVPAANYTYDAASNQIVFATTPPEKSVILISFKRDVPLGTDFTIGNNVKAGTLVAKVNNIQVTNYTYFTSGVVRFDAPPAEGALVTFTYVGVGDPIYSYPFTVNGQAPQNLTIYDSDTRAAIPFVTYTLGNVVFNTFNWVEGRKVTLQYRNPNRDRLTVSLPNVPVAGSVYATDGSAVCQGANKIVVAGQQVQLQGCGFPDTATTIQVVYSYIIATKSSFTFDSSDLPDASVPQTWKVWVNGVLRQDYTRGGNVVTFAAPLPVGSSVKIHVTYEKL